MSNLSNIPPHAVLPLQSYDRNALRSAAARAEQRVLQADCRGATDADSVLGEIAVGFSLPAPGSAGFEALYNRVTGLQPVHDADEPGFVVFLENLPETAAFDRKARDRLLDVFRDAADYFFDRQTAFRVFYSVDRKA
ncbi:MAG: barstar family protein [Burkholderiaceae bacterium]|nr:barstar family protein [Burkholderiaceae bacterium]